jgi:hypothetical protein
VKNPSCLRAVGAFLGFRPVPCSVPTGCVLFARKGRRTRPRALLRLRTKCRIADGCNSMSNRAALGYVPPKVETALQRKNRSPCCLALSPARLSPYPQSTAGTWQEFVSADMLPAYEGRHVDLLAAPGYTSLGMIARNL